ncbi:MULTISPECIES: maleylpyruvate isomerase N-terminal domain-containing protein [unclassified Rhodococcus (in: high G+C Gram-positive bacteria)]|uniref:maleylpyruvate isomerase N-terminal domain-containing protein n=1 Tax=unclassified Rhodococcus (in: high G+C Gram-positive bacteria) TaxID=192944 RepID=UPI001FF8640D|nr:MULTISPECIES: maleylpyruvate isomerase N-terminal domain-containing protein [unclassified Rhodococcus (in: high G+C Gram-positive bacteria)]
MTDLIDLAAAERRDLADYLDTLTEDEWEQQSLCSGWTVRDVVAHVSSFDVLSWPALFAVFARSRFSLTRCNQAGVDDARPPAQYRATDRAAAHSYGSAGTHHDVRPRRRSN